MRRGTKVALGVGALVGIGALVWAASEGDAKASPATDPFADDPNVWDPDGLRPGSHRIKTGSEFVLLPGKRWGGLELNTSGDAMVEILTVFPDGEGLRGQVEAKMIGTSGSVEALLYDDDTVVARYVFTPFADATAGPPTATPQPTPPPRGGGFEGGGGLAGDTGRNFDPGKHENSSYPTGGKMYQVRRGELFGGTDSDRSIAYRLLLSEAYTAAREVLGMGDSAAKSFARSIATDGVRRQHVIDLIQCVGFNDAVYGTWGYGPNATPGPHGRAIRLLPYHPRNRDRLEQGLEVQRNIRIGNYQRPGDGSGTAYRSELSEAFEFLLMPRLDRELLARQKRIEPAPGGMDPPFDWTIAVYEDGLSGREFGCEGGEVRI